MSDSSHQEVVTRTFNVHRFDPHPRRKILIICGEVLITVTNPSCAVVLAEESREFKKLITLKRLTREVSRESVVDAVYKECPFIDPSLRLHLAVTIDFIKNRHYDDNDMVITPSNSLSTPSTTPTQQPQTPTDFIPEFDADSTTISTLEAELNEKVDLASLDSYVELLYEEDFSEKIRGARCLAKLSKISENLGGIACHETALNAAFRTLREDYRKSLDLTKHLMTLCLNYAQYRDFHPLLLSNKICSFTFDLVEFELQRYDRWRMELGRKQDVVENRSDFPGSAGSYQKAKTEFEKMRQKFNEVTRKQDHVLALSFEVLLYLSENVGLFHEIHARGVVHMLMETLSRKNIDLLKVALKFLKNMSIYSICKKEMSQLYVAEKIMQLLDANIPNEIIHCCLDLSYNLAFDTKLRHKLVMFGVLPKLAFYLEDSVLEFVTRKLLYIMSMDRKIRSKFSGISQIIPLLSKILQENREEPARNSLDVAALLVNLATNRKCAVAICGGEDGGLLSFLQQAFESEDEIIMKIVRNLSQHKQTKGHFAPFICDLARAILDASSEDFILECIGTLGNMDMPNIDFSKLLQEFQLVPWIKRVFKDYLNNPNGSKKHHNLTLEVVVLVGTCCSDGECADLLIEEGVLDQLIKILITTSDLELKTQVLYVFYKMCAHSGTKQHIQEGTQIPKIVLELLHHENIDVQQLCEAVMNQFGETDEGWMEKLREKRFRFFNEAWIEMTERSGGAGAGAGDFDDDFNYAYGNGNKEKMVIDMHASSASETLITEDDSGEEGSDLEVDHEELLEEDGSLGHGAGGGGRKLFDKFKAQYEHEMRAREQMERGESTASEEEEEVVDQMESSAVRNSK